MKSLKSCLVAAVAALLGSSALGAALEITGPTDYSTVPLLSSGMKAWKTKTFAQQKSASATADTTARKKSQTDYSTNSLPVRISWSGGTAPYAVRVVRSHGGSGKAFYEGTVSDTHVDLMNLEVGRNYTWTVTSGASTATGHFFTEPDAPRAINCAECVIDNTRDMGGWATEDGKVVKQGMVYRSESFDYYTPTNPDADPMNPDHDPWTAEMTVKFQRFWNDKAAIKTEIDLREIGDLEDAREEYGFKDSVISNAHVIISEDICGVTFNDACYYKAFTTANGKKAMLSIITNFANSAYYPFIFHCRYGKDRTGTLALVLNALLGVPEDSLRDDYAFTYYAVSEHKANSNFDSVSTMITKLNAFEGATLKDKTAAYLLSIGVTQAQIDAIRTNLLEDPETADAKPVSEVDEFVYKDYYFRRTGWGGSWNSDSIYWYKTRTGTTKAFKASDDPHYAKGADAAVWFYPYGANKYAYPVAIGSANTPAPLGRIVTDNTYGNPTSEIGFNSLNAVFSNVGHTVTDRPFWEHVNGTGIADVVRFFFDGAANNTYSLTMHPNTGMIFQFLDCYGVKSGALYTTSLSTSSTHANFKSSPAYLKFLPGGNQTVYVQEDGDTHLYSKIGWFTGGDVNSTQTFVFKNAFLEFTNDNHDNAVQGKLAFEFELGDFVKTSTALAMCRARGALTINQGSTLKVDAGQKDVGDYKLISSVKSLVCEDAFLQNAQISNLKSGTKASITRSSTGNTLYLHVEKGTAKTSVTKPTVESGLVYSGKSMMGIRVAQKGDDTTCYTLSGTLEATTAGTYKVTAKLNSGYQWPDGSTTALTLNWTIAKAANEWKTLPSMSPLSFPLGTAVSVGVGTPAFGTSVATYSAADVGELGVGTYTNTFTVVGTGNYSELSDSIVFTVLQPQVEPQDIVISVPAAIDGLLYNGQVQTGVPAGTGYTVTGNTATEAGDYIATVTPAEGYVWEDGSKDAQMIGWSIGLPYEQLWDWLKTDNLGYIVTDYIPKLDQTKVEFTLQYLPYQRGGGRGDALCAANGKVSGNSWPNCYQLFSDDWDGINYQNWGPNHDVDIWDDCMFDLINDPERVVTVSSFRNVMTVDSFTVTSEEEPETGAQASSPLYLFGWPYRADKANAPLYVFYQTPKCIYSVKIWEIDGGNTNLVMDLVPATALDGSATLYDRVHHTCLKTTNGQGFTCGSNEPVEIPTAIQGLVYDGTEQLGVTENPHCIYSNAMATAAGTYTAIVKLKGGYFWTDGTTAPKEIVWSIAPGGMSDDFVEVEYIENISDSYIDTGVQIQDKIASSVDHAYTAFPTDGSYMLAANGKFGGSHNDRLYLASVNKASEKKWRVGLGSKTALLNDLGTAQLNVRYVAEAKVNGSSITFTLTNKTSGTAAKTVTEKLAEVVTPDEPKALTLFALNTSSITYFALAKLYGCKIWTNGGAELARDFVPCYKKSTQQYGLYDRVSGGFFASLSENGFIGPHVDPEPEPKVDLSALLPEEVKCVAIVAPSTQPASNDVVECVRSLEKAGKTVKVYPSAWNEVDAAAKARDIEAAWQDPETDLILCARGGSGSFNTLTNLDFSVLKARDVPFMGFSNISTLLNGFVKMGVKRPIAGPLATTLVTYPHTDASISRAHDVLAGAELPSTQLSVRRAPSAAVTGKPLGGHVPSIASMTAGWIPDTTGRIVFLEYNSSYDYTSATNMFRIVNSRGWFDNAAAVVLCDMGITGTASAKENLRAHITDSVTCPVFSGYDFGHIEGLLALDFGRSLTITPDGLLTWAAYEPEEPDPAGTPSAPSPANFETVAGLLDDALHAFNALSSDEKSTQMLQTGTPYRDGLMASAQTNLLPVVLSWQGTVGPCSVSVVRECDGKVVFATVTSTGSAKFYNPEIGRNYRWTVTCAGNSATWYFYTGSEGPRIINPEVGQIGNARDFGGWSVGETTVVRQGAIYRSRDFQEFITNGVPYWTDVLGVKLDVDLRHSSDIEDEIEEYGMGSAGVSPLGADVPRYCTAIDKGSDIWFGGDYNGLFYTSPDGYQKAFWLYFAKLADESVQPALFHCSAGRDRTGCLAFIMGAVLGMSEDDLHTDYYHSMVYFGSGDAGDSPRGKWLPTFVKGLDDWVKSTSKSSGGKAWVDANGIDVAMLRGKAEAFLTFCGNRNGLTYAQAKAAVDAFRESMIELKDEKRTAAGKYVVPVPTVASKLANGQLQKADMIRSPWYTIVNEGGTAAGDYDVVLTLNDPENAEWAGGGSTAKTLKFTIVPDTPVGIEFHEWLETDDQGYFITDYIPNLGKTKVEFKVQFLPYERSNGDVLCAANGWLNGGEWGRYYHLFSDAWDGVNYENVVADGPAVNIWAGKDEGVFGIIDDPSHVATISAFRDTLTVDNLAFTSETEPGNASASDPMLLFGYPYRQKAGKSLIVHKMTPKRVYSVKIWEIDGGVTNLVYDLVPVSNKTENVATLYNRKTGLCLTATNGGGFIAGDSTVATPTVNGKPVVHADIFNPASEDVRARSDRPIVYPSTPTVAGDVGSQTITYQDVSVNVPAYYTATPDDNNRVLLALNDNAKPVIENGGEKQGILVDETAGTVQIHLGNVKEPLYYTILWSADLLGDWEPVSAYEQNQTDFTIQKDASKVKCFYKGAVKDVPDSLK